MRWLPFLLAAGMLTAPFALAEGGDRRDALKDRLDDRGEHGPGFHAEQDKWVLRNDNITIWFHNGERSKPALQVLRTGDDGNKTGFRLQLEQLFEVRANGAANASDDDGDEGDGPDFHAVHAHGVNLQPAKEWWTQVQNGTDEVTITMAHLFNQGNVTLVFHVPKDGSAVKFDVQLRDWKWANATDQLALRLKVLERGAKQDGDNATFDGGFVSWAKTAQATYPDGHHATLDVKGIVRAHDEGAHIVLLFNGTGGYKSLDYDPVIGLTAASAASSAVPGPGLLAAVAVVGLAGLVLGRKR